MLKQPVLTAAEKDRLFYLETRNSPECQCERPKQRGRALCYKCWVRLPHDIRRALYRPLGGGFEAAYEDAYRHLHNL